MRKILLIIALVSILISSETKQKNTSKNTKQKFKCEGKRYCKEMSSCEEAFFYLRQCGLSRLDRDKDGVPCEVICRSYAICKTT